MQITINPADENNSTLRAVALMLSSIASDRDGWKAGQVNVNVPDGVNVTATINQDTLPPIVGNEQPVAPGASTDSIPPPPPITGASENGSTTNGDELDANGLPWDKRIHSSSKNKNQDQTWRYIRVANADDKPAFEELKKTVEAELRARTSNGALAADAPPPPPPIVVTGQTNVTTETSDLTPPPPPPLETQQQTGAGVNPDLLKQQAFKRLSGLTAEQRTEALGLVDLKTPADFLKEVKARPELAAELIDAIVALTGEE